MTLRFIVRECDLGAAMHVGGPVNTRHRTFDLDIHELEQHLRAEGQPEYVRREVIGVEMIDATPDAQSSDGGQPK